MTVLGAFIVLAAVASNGTRMLLLALVLLAVVLLVVGSAIAVVTLRNQRKTALAYSASREMERQAS